MIPFCAQFTLIHIPTNNRVTQSVWMIGVWGLHSQRRLGISLFSIGFRQSLWPTQPHIQWVPGALPPGLKRPGR